MRKVEQIEQQIRELSAGEFSELREWVLDQIGRLGMRRSSPTLAPASSTRRLLRRKRIIRRVGRAPFEAFRIG